MKPVQATLSEHLLAEAKRFVGYPTRHRSKRVAEDWDAKILPHSAARHTGIVPNGKSFDLPDLLNEHYAKKFLSEVPGFVSRTLALRPLSGTAKVPRQVTVYLEQAMNGYVIGLWDGAIALARACLEEALEDRIGHYIGRQKWDLDEWIAKAEGKRLISSIQSKRARAIQDLGNIVLHERSATEAEAENVMSALRDLLVDLYRLNL